MREDERLYATKDPSGQIDNLSSSGRVILGRSPIKSFFEMIFKYAISPSRIETLRMPLLQTSYNETGVSPQLK